VEAAESKADGKDGAQLGSRGMGLREDGMGRPVVGIWWGGIEGACVDARR